MSELDTMRVRVGRLLLILLWVSLPVAALVALAVGRAPAPPTVVSALLAGTYSLFWWRNGTAPVTRYVSAVALVGKPALLTYLMSGHAWQIDMHMYFFAMLALCIAWCDWRVVLLAAIVVIGHHLLLNFLLPSAIFPNGANIGRVAFHAAIVALESAVLIWLAIRLEASFTRIARLDAENQLQNETLELKVRQRTLEAESANRAKSLFLANMSHEIRTPMSGILGFCHLLLRTELTERQRDYISKAQRACLSLLGLIDDILDLSKIEVGQLSLEHTDFDLRKALENTLGLVAGQAADRGITIRQEVAAAVPAVLRGDALRLNQILLNLISNAIKFTERGNVTITIRALETSGARVTLEIAVSDTGIGLTPEQIATLFRPFSQAETSTTRRFGGTGLGLSISKQLVELMGGTIRAESLAGVGSVFTFTVVMGIADVAERTARIFPAEFRHLHVLIVDDNSGSRAILEDMFVNWGISPDMVASGAEALAALASAASDNTPYDLVMMDWKMSGLDGMQTAEAMQDLPGLIKRPFVVMITAYGHGEQRTAAEAAGIDAFLLKPVEPGTLLTTITSLFAARQSLEPAPAIIAPSETDRAPDLSGRRILLVEDNAINREIAFELLTSAGLLVDIAENGRVACDRISDTDCIYDAVLMDVQMPEMDGIEATVRIRQHWTRERLPIIAMTAHAYEAERRRCLEAGMNDHIAKPFDPALLTRTLNRWLKPLAQPPGARPAQPLVRPVDELPNALPPFDLDAALTRLDGNRVLLRKLIVDFGDSFAETMPNLRDRITGGSLTDGRFLAHTLKGVAAILELHAVASAAAGLEDALAASDTVNVGVLLDRLELAMVPALAAATSLKRASAPPVQAIAAPMVAVPTTGSARDPNRSPPYRQTAADRPRHSDASGTDGRIARRDKTPVWHADPTDIIR